MLLALDFALDTPKEIVIVTAGGRAAAEPLLRAVRGTFVPNRVLVVPSDAGRIADLVPLVEGKVAQGGRPTAYVCERRRCELPTGAPRVHYVDFDRALHWVRRAPRELAAVLRAARRHPVLVLGRTEKAHRSHHVPLYATEAVANRLLAGRLGLVGRIDLLVPS